MIRLITGEFEEKIKEIKKHTSFANCPEEAKVRSIVQDVRDNGNSALLRYISEFEYPASIFHNLKVTETEIDLGHSRLPQDLVFVMQRAIENIRAFHEGTLPKSWTKQVSNHSSLGMKVTPIKRVGVYVPGGTASYPSSVLMNVIPAQVAGVEDIVLVSPSNKEGKVNDGVLGAARELGINQIYRMGGAQAIAALAYGTEDFDPVDKIVGPGNIFVNLAKKEVSGVVGIDKMAGPSDICIIADKASNAKYVVADMLAQCEHDKLSSAILITDSNDFGYTVKKEIEASIMRSERADILEEAIDKNSAIFVVGEGDYAKIVELINLIAPEHLEIFHDAYRTLMQNIRNAGAIFIGEYSAEVLGDYVLGPNHVLPTGGTARYASPLSCADFVKSSTITILDKRDFFQLGSDAIKFAEYEQLPAHANAVRIRI